jgi:hypothetical protein
LVVLEFIDWNKPFIVKQRQAKTSKDKQRDENKIQEVQVKVTDKKTRVKDKEDQWFEAK